MRSSEIAKFLGAELTGVDIEILGACSLKNLKPNHIAFYKFDDPIICPSDLLTIIVGMNCPVEARSYIRAENPRLAHARVVERFFYDNVLYSMPYRKLDCHDVWFYGLVDIGKNFKVKPGAVIGSEGFGFENDENGVPVRRPHIGGVMIGDSVEVGANTCIDRGTLDDTVIGDNVKIDNLVHIAHNCEIGENTCVVAGSVVCGSTVIGRNCWIGANATLMQHITIGDNVTIGMGAVVVKDVPNNSVLAGFKAQPISTMQKLTECLEKREYEAPMMYHQSYLEM